MEGKATYLAFLDFRKAYDTVPHEALFAKLRHCGIRGSALDFIVAVYANSKLSVKLPWGVTSEVEFLRGSRQGCPMSPTLFNVFINDLLDGLLGVRVPGVKGRIPGLLYADDGVLATEDAGGLQVSLDHVGVWAKIWEMSFGIPKCGAMVINGDMDRLRASALCLSGDQLPVVDSYVYLGLHLHHSWCLDFVTKHRVIKASNALGALRVVLKQRRTPLRAKVLVVKSKLLPVLCYGGELLGMNSRRVSKLQRVLTDAIGLMTRSALNKASAVVLRRELGIPSVMASMSGMRARACKKFPTLPSWARYLTSAIRPNQFKASWTKRTMGWLKRYQGNIALEVFGLDLKEEPDADKQFAAEVRKEVTFREWEAGIKKNQVSVIRYHERKFHKSRQFLVLSVKYPRLALGVRELLRVRVGSFWTGLGAAKSHLILDEFKTECPCCKRSVPESLVHLVSICERWSVERSVLVKALPLQFKPTKDYIAWAWSLMGRALSRSRLKLWLMGNPEKGPLKCEPVYASVAVFLQSIYFTRNRLLWKSTNLISA